MKSKARSEFAGNSPMSKNGNTAEKVGFPQVNFIEEREEKFKSRSQMNR
jgi:hypothetical protein